MIEIDDCLIMCKQKMGLVNKKYFIGTIILTFLFGSCKTLNNSHTLSSNKFTINALKEKAEINYSDNKVMTIFVLAFENAYQQNYYHFFNEEYKKLSYHMESIDDKLKMVKYSPQYSSFLLENINNILRNDFSLILVNSKSCEDCYSVVIYKFKKTKNNIRFLSDSLISDNYIGLLE